ncbi:MAG: hypothetical protein SGBAC_012779 [Bacillariaceae sp.]
MLEPKELDVKGEFSDVLFITGLLCKGRSDEDVQRFLSISEVMTFVEIMQQIDDPGGGKLWVRCESIQQAKKVQAILHQQSFKGAVIMCRYELGFDPETGKRRVSRNSIHTTCIRKVQQRRGESNNRNKGVEKISMVPANYSYKSLSIGETEYPFPSGMYLARLISLVQKWPNNRTDDPLIELVSNNYVPPGAKKKKNKNPGSIFGNKYPKEITESMAMVDAVERALKLCLGRSTCSFQTSSSSTKTTTTTSVRVYCVGDGKYPITAATMALNYPYPGWEFVSIDPLLDPIELNGHPHNLVQFTGLSQDYILPVLPPASSQDDDAQSSETEKVEHVDIVVACHSHAPLQEFWDRVLERIHSNQNGGGGVCRAVAITMACCANYSDIMQPPSLVFDDYEVYSPKRQIRIYSDNLVCTSVRSDTPLGD